MKLPREKLVGHRHPAARGISLLQAARQPLDRDGRLASLFAPVRLVPSTNNLQRKTPGELMPVHTPPRRRVSIFRMNCQGQKKTFI